MDNDEIKKFYSQYADRIQDKRFNSPYKIRKYAHHETYLSIIKHLKSGDKILEVGCGEGVLSVLAAQKGFDITASDISKLNIEAARKLAEKQGVGNISFLEADAENLPFKDDSFDIVIADNILEHLPDFRKGLAEIKRVTKKTAIIALPTCLNPCAWCLLGGDIYWKITRRTPYAMIWGFLKVIAGMVSGKNGINEGYNGVEGLPHLWRYPWTMEREIREAGFRIISFEAASICLPYFNSLMPLIKFLDKYKSASILRRLGYGSIAVVEKI